MKPRLILLTLIEGAALDRVRAIYPNFDVIVARSLAELNAAPPFAHDVLLSFGSGVIVPSAVLSTVRRSFNLHAASPEFPGRDPHHHAVYRLARRYGATLHEMTARVDEGPIIAVERFDVSPGTTPPGLLAEANEAGVRLLEKFGERLMTGELAGDPNERWSGSKTSRTDLLRLGEISPLIDAAELDRRVHALAADGYDNLRMVLHHRYFALRPIGPQPTAVRADGHFTEAAIAALLEQLLAAGYRFVGYGENARERHVIWRHDVAFSMHRAARLAEIEKARGVRATYFVNPRSAFYNLLEADVAAKTSVIKNCGHEIGLHFDAPAPADGTWTQTALETALTKEKALLEAIIERPVRCVSWRNLDQSTLQACDDDQIAGLQNGDSARLRRDYVHCSDTNGYWRFAPMAEVIAAGHERLHLLTDPVWWTDAPMAPSARIHRAIFGRALAVRRAYDALEARSGRQNRDF